MSSTELAVIEEGGFLALQHDPTEIQEVLSENLGGQKLEQRHLPRVKIPSGGGTTWEIPNEQPTKELTGILVSFKAGQRAYWKSDDLSNTPPDCRSSDGIVGVGTPGGVCESCPHAQFGSKGDGQACSQSEVWFLLRQGLFLPLVLKLPATSIKAAEAYRIGVLGSALIRVHSVVTSITLEATKDGRGNPYSVAKITKAGHLTKEEAAKAKAYAIEMAPLFEDAAREAVVSNDRGFNARETPAADVEATAEAEADAVAAAHQAAEAAADAEAKAVTDHMFDPAEAA